jgi:two-component system, cell cycle response regulator
MTARILVVDDVPANLRLLEAQLTAEYFDVVSAASGAEALSICERGECDLVLLDVMMPDMDGIDVCRRLKSDPSTQHIPVVMITALDQPSDRVRGLDAGADDFLTKPTSDLVLIARVRSLVRLKMMTDELRMRALTSREIGLENPAREAVADIGRGAHVLIVDDRKTSWERMARSLASEHIVDVEVDPRQAMFHAAEASFDHRLARARAHAQPAAARGRRGRGQFAADARPRDRRQRLSDPAGRPERVARAGAHPDQEKAVCREAARQCADVDRGGDHRRADRIA